MGQRNSKVGSSSGSSAATRTYGEMTGAQAETLREQYESGFSDDVKKSVDKYISRGDFDGQGHSLSQVMNHAINEGIDLQTATLDEVNSQLGLSLTRRQFAALKHTDANIDAAMHPIGADVQLQRGCHEGDLRRLFGITDYTKMSESELQERLVGGTFTNRAVMSTSYDVKSNPFLGGGSVSGGRELVYNIKAKAGTPMVWGSMEQTEAILGKSIKWRVTGVRFSGKTALPRSKGYRVPQLEIDIETI